MKKQTQPEANYRRGNPINHCGVCVFYQGHHRCSRVMGDISPYGLSNVYRHDVNPFGKTLAPNEVEAIKLMAADAADRSGQVQAPSRTGLMAPAPRQFNMTRPPP
jgi:hypothetical protein